MIITNGRNINQKMALLLRKLKIQVGISVNTLDPKIRKRFNIGHKVDYIEKIKNAGFSDVKIESRYTFTERDGEIASLFSGCCGERSEQNNVWTWIPELHGKISSVKISARKV